VYLLINSFFSFLTYAIKAQVSVTQKKISKFYQKIITVSLKITWASKHEFTKRLFLTKDYKLLSSLNTSTNWLTLRIHL